MSEKKKEPEKSGLQPDGSFVLDGPGAFTGINDNPYAEYEKKLKKDKERKEKL